MKSTQSRSSELSPQSFCLLQVSVWLMQRPAGKEGMKTEAEEDAERARWPRPHHPPLSHWKWSLQLTGASLHWADGWQALSSASSTLQGEPPNWDGLRTDRVRNCGGPSGSSSMTSFQHREEERWRCGGWSGRRCGRRPLLACFWAQGEQADQELNSVSRQSMGQLCWLQPLLSDLRHSCEQLLLQ